MAENSLTTTIFDDVSALRELIQDRLVRQIVCNKLYKRQLITNIMFEFGKYHEDEFWSYQVIGNIRRLVVVDYVGYHYLQRKGSIMGSEYSLRRLDSIEAKCLRQEYLEKRFPQLSFEGRINLLFSCIYQGQLAINSSVKTEALKRLKNSMNSVSFSLRERRRIPVKQRIWIFFSKHSFNLCCRVRNLLKIGT